VFGKLFKNNPTSMCWDKQFNETVTSSVAVQSTVEAKSSETV